MRFFTASWICISQTRMHIHGWYNILVGPVLAKPILVNNTCMTKTELAVTLHTNDWVNPIQLKFTTLQQRLDNTSQGLYRATPVFWQYKIWYL